MKYLIFLAIIGIITVLFLSGFGFRIWRMKKKIIEEVECRKSSIE